QRLHPSKQVISNLTLVANAPFFNGPNFTWMDKYLNLPNIRIRGVNQRLCELSRFVVLKTTQLGPPAVIVGLPEAAAMIQKPGGWFSRYYQSVKTWNLPDHSQAILYMQKRLRTAPFRAQSAHFEYYREGHVSLRNVKVSFKSWNAINTDYGRIEV